MHPKAKIHHNLEQGTPEWLDARNGLLTASEVNLILTPTIKVSNNDKTRKHVYEIAAQRISGYTEPTYIGDAMLRGHADEITARDLYSQRYEPVEEYGFITREIEGVTIGYSPDGVGVLNPFGIECKSRLQKYQIEVITSNEVPTEHILQVQTGLLVTGWDYIDYISYSGGLPMWVIRVEPDLKYQDAIIDAAVKFDANVSEVSQKYHDALTAAPVLIETEREETMEDIVIT